MTTIPVAGGANHCCLGSAHELLEGGALSTALGTILSSPD